MTIIKFSLVFWFLSPISLLAQIEPTQNDAELLKMLRVKNRTTYYYHSPDTLNAQGTVVLKKEFDAAGSIISKYVLSPWEPISYANNTRYSYNEIGQLAEETTIQQILNLSQRDEDYINSFGDTPLNTTTQYFYNEDGHLVRKELYTYATDKLPAGILPSQTIEFSYENSQLYREQSSSLHKRFFDRSYTTIYRYNDRGEVIEKATQYGSEANQHRSTTYQYDSAGLLVEEQTLDKAIPRNNEQLKYTHDHRGRVVSKLIYDAVAEDFVPTANFTYDAFGNMTSGERDVDFSYYPNKLIKTEQWKDEITEQTLLFVNKYQYWP
ncbi:MAG: hypothetical protein HC819_04210 [Cyclobacteriaceae bacterium]|nr:hypothetical protein [Cyclobacteriaceae bacterium]